jgi:ribonuclease BN (tRNA processing enzyme)
VAHFADKAGVDRLMLFHHDPMHSDDQLEQMREDVIERWGVDGDRCTLAAEGLELSV